MYLRKIIFLLYLVVPVATNAVESKISINFTDIETRDLLKILTERANKSIVISEKIDSKITLNLNNVRWREALDTVLKIQGLIKHEVGNVIIILTPGEVAKSEGSILKKQVFNLQHVEAKNVAGLLKPAGILSGHGKLSVDSKSNSLVVADISSNIAAVKKFIKEIDVSAKQVIIEARIVSADETFLRDLGVELSGYAAITTNGLKRKSESVNLNRGQFNFAIAKMGGNVLLDLQLAALETEGRGRVISRPKLLTTDRETALIEAGAEIPYQEKTKKGYATVAFKKAVLSLKVTPEVVDKNRVNLVLELNQDKIGQLVIDGVPTIDTRKIHTKVLINNNETVVLGGIYEWTRSSRTIGLPFLGQIPLIKVLFSRKVTRVERKELLVFVTPRII